jgi:hypothetical protein
MRLIARQVFWKITILFLSLSGCSRGTPNAQIQAEMNQQTNILQVTTVTFTQPGSVESYTPEM